jgi:tetratricopeptide (TPR) repeat protein
VETSAMSGRDAITSGEQAELAGDYLGAVAAFQSALGDSDASVVADAEFHLGRIAWRQSRLDDAIEHYNTARAMALRQINPELRARVENGLGAVHYAKGEFEQARASYALALELATDKTQRGHVHLNLGAICNIQGDLDGARSNYAKSRAYFQQTGYVRGEIMALHNLGMLQADLELWDEADESYRRCLALLEQEGDRQHIGHLLLDRSEVACGRGQFDDAIANCDLAMSIYAEIGDEAGRGEALRWKGHALRQMSRHDDAERTLNDAIRIARRLQGKLLEAEALGDLGDSLAARGEIDEGRKAFSRAFSLFQELGAQRELTELQKRMEAITM